MDPTSGPTGQMIIVLNPFNTLKKHGVKSVDIYLLIEYTKSLFFKSSNFCKSKLGSYMIHELFALDDKINYI